MAPFGREGGRELGQESPGDVEQVLLGLMEDLALPAGPEENSPVQVLGRLCETVCRLPGVAAAGAMWNLDGRLRHVAATNAAITRLQNLQQSGRSGPSVDAFRSIDVVTVTNMGAEQERWPDLARMAQAEGIAALAAVPLGDQGALCICDGTAHAWSDDQLTAAGALGDVAAGRLVGEVEYQLLSRIRADLQHALDSRVVVEQAKGMVAADHGVSVDRALGMLRSYARSNHLELRTVATAVVSGRLHL